MDVIAGDETVSGPAAPRPAAFESAVNA